MFSGLESFAFSESLFSIHMYLPIIFKYQVLFRVFKYSEDVIISYTRKCRILRAKVDMFKSWKISKTVI